MKLSEGFTRIIPSILIFVFYVLSFMALTMALKRIDVSIAYTIWAGAGTALIVIIGVVHFREPLTLIRVMSVGMIIIGVIGLNINVRHRNQIFLFHHHPEDCIIHNKG